MHRTTPGHQHATRRASLVTLTRLASSYLIEAPRQIKLNPRSLYLPPLLLTFVVLSLNTTATWCSAATFSGNASLKADDPSGSLTSVNGIFTVSFWFRLSVPSSLNLTTDMVLVMDRADGNQSANFSYLVRVNATNGNLEFVTRGSGLPTPFVKTLISGLYVERWYHVAVARGGNLVYGYVDGVQVFADSLTGIGATTGAGLAIGGINGASNFFYGDIVELAIHQSQLAGTDIQQYMFADQRDYPGIAGYYKLGYSADAADNLRNFVPVPPPGTDPAQKLGTGSVSFPEVDRAGEQSIFDSRVNGGKDALAPLSGAFVWQQSALSRPVRGISFDFRFGYSTALPPGDGSADPYEKRTLSPRWRHIFDSRVVKPPTGDILELRLLTWDGAIETWDRPGIYSPFTIRHGEYRGELTQLLSSDVEWTTPERLVYHFYNPYAGGANLNMAGRLLSIRDAHSNSVQLQWNWSLARITNVVDTAGGRYAFTYNALGLLTNISFGAWQLNFGYDASNRLASKSFTNTSGLYTNVNATWRFYYNDSGHANTIGLLNRIVDPRGNDSAVVQYDRYRRKTQLSDPLNQTVQIAYGVPDSRTIRVTDPDGYASYSTFDRKGRLTVESDPLGNTRTYLYNQAGLRVSAVEPDGRTNLFNYDERGNMIARTNALGQVTRWTFHSVFNKVTSETNPLEWATHFVIDDNNGDLLAQYDDLGLIATNQYSSDGLLTASTDGRGNMIRTLYDTNGFIAGQTDAAGNTTRYALNDLAWRMAVTNALGQVTTLAYDLNGNVVRTRDPLLRVFTRAYDNNGNLLSESDGKGQLTSYAYDPLNQRTNMVDRTGTNNWTFIYTKRGKLAYTINPLNISTANFYDAANRLVQVAAPLGNVVKNAYDANWNLTNVTDQLGRSWSKSYDKLNRVITETDPHGNVRLTDYDPVGRIKQVTSPKGFVSVHDYDNRGRLVRWTDPQGSSWQYAYDACGNITNITDALGGQYVMVYSNRNERILERNQDGFVWRYRYDKLLRPDQQTDPNGVTRTIVYDAGNRVDYVTFSTGRTDDYTFDSNGNLEHLLRTGPGQAPTRTDLTYDPMDRVATVTDALCKTIGYEYDAVGRRSKLIYPDGKTLAYGYDALNRLTTQVDWAGRQMGYQYDAASRLVRRTYPNTVIQINTFDESGRLDSLTYLAPNPLPQAINIAINYAYDRNGNKTAITERGTLEAPLSALTDEAASHTASGRLIDRSVTDTNQTLQFTYHYDAAGNMTNATGNGQSWTLSYDEDNRTTAISWTSGVTNKEIINRYDTMGRRIAKTVDGEQIGYVLDVGADMERTLCDLAADGHITAHYIHGPDLCYKVTPDATETVVYYHADAQANIITLTGDQGSNLAQYAYSPYGRILASTNLWPSNLTLQPFTFVGSQGVVEEMPGLFFMRARYYSAEACVFLSCDPVKNTGPGAKPIAYAYGRGNPLGFVDPQGELYSELNMLFKLGSGELEWKDISSAFASEGACRYLTKQGLKRFVAVFNVVSDVAEIADDIDKREGLAGFLYDEAQNAVEGAQTALKEVEDWWDAPPSIIPGIGGIEREVKSWKWKALEWNRSNEQQPSQLQPTATHNINNTIQATAVAEMSNRGNSSGVSGSGAASSSPLLSEVLHSKAGRAKTRYRQYSAQASQYYGVYQQYMAAYGQLKTSFENSDFLRYLIWAQQPRQMADQAYAKYRYWDRRADQALDSYYDYKGKEQAAKGAGL